MEVYTVDESFTTPDLTYVPHELGRLDQWVAWLEEYDKHRYDERHDRSEGVGKPKKKPYRLTPPHTDASTSDAGTWGTFRDACALVGRAGMRATGGVGFVLTEDDPLCCLDFDGAIDTDGVVHPEVDRIVKELGSYAERSPSGTGLHVWVMGTKPGPRTKAAVGNGVTVEVFDARQFVTFTGNVFLAAPLQERQEALNALYARFFPEEVEPTTADGAYGGLEGGFEGDDEDLLERARGAKTGTEFSALHDEGDLSLTGGDHSRADFKLNRMYAFWTDGDAERMDRLFRRSALYRPDKWDEVHRGDGATYGEMTVQKAMSACKNVYRPGRGSKATLAGEDVQAALDAVEDEVWRQMAAGAKAWKGKAGNTNACTTFRLIALGRERGVVLPTGAVFVRESYGELEEDGKVSRPTVAGYMKRIKATGLVRQHHAEKRGDAGGVVLVPPKESSARNLTTVSTRGIGIDNGKDSRAPAREAVVSLRHSVRGVKRFNKGGEIVLWLLARRGAPLTPVQMEDATGIRARDLRRRILPDLVAWDVLIHDPRAGTYGFGPDWQDRLAAAREYGGEVLQDEAQSARIAAQRAAYALYDAEVLHARKPTPDALRKLTAAQSAMQAAGEAHEVKRRAYREFLDAARLHPAGVAADIEDGENGCAVVALYPDSIPSGEAFGMPTASVSELPARVAANPVEDDKEPRMGTLLPVEGFPRQTGVVPNDGAVFRHYAHEPREIPPELIAAIKRDDPATRDHPDDCGCLSCETLLPDLPRYARHREWPARKIAVPEDAPREKDYAPCAAKVCVA